MMDESASLTNPSFKKSPIALYLWWALNIAIVIFVFLAFLMSTLSYTHSKDLANQVNNSFITQQGGLIEREYKVAPAFTVKRGSVVSFCGEGNIQLCEGLGPKWGREFTPSGVGSPAAWGVFAGMGPTGSLYFYTLDADPMSIRVTYVDTSSGAQPSAKGNDIYNLPTNVWGVHAHNTSTPGVAVVLYTSNNDTYLQTVSVDSQGNPKFNPPAVLGPINDPNQNGTAIRNLVVADNFIILSHGYNYQGVQYQVFVIDGSTTRLKQLGPKTGTFAPTIVDTIQTHYLGNGYLIQANANNAYLGKITFNTNNAQIDVLGSAEWFVHFNTLQIHGVGIPTATGGQLLFIGTQYAYVDDPLTLSMFVEWQTTPTYLTVHPPTNLLGSIERQPLYGQVSLCYLAPNDQEPYGGIFFSFIDARDSRAKIVRARPTYTDYNLHLLPSPALHISSHRYGRFRSWLVPTVHCNLATGPTSVLIALQDFLPVFNTFSWHGGYRFAGLAQADANANANVDVIRAGISWGFERLTPGFTYYVWNNGTIAPFSSLFETFTPNGYPFPVGTAISEGHLYIESEAFDFF